MEDFIIERILIGNVMAIKIIFTVIITLIYVMFYKNISYKHINKKLLTALITTIVFSSLGVYKIFFLRNELFLAEIICYVLIEVIIVLTLIGMYKKNKICGIINFIFVLISIYSDYLIDKNKALPIIVFIVYLRSLLYFDIFWDGTLGIFAYHKKLKIDDDNDFNSNYM
ncbi:hypothetical protein [Clostridium intestinale]|uniref:hypothetical protein n=1 Tax=Clostridium intestinale TaxID=36845 RepID=UPI002DD689FF|nr:hypothetical protein [Clostridium intestinale]WRY52694.1 hypothetical protein P8F83_05715 [Clostridium intestinale]